MVNFLMSLEKRNRPFWIVVGCALIGMVGTLDYLTGNELALWLFYLIPIALLTWLRGRWLGIAASIVCGVVWVGTDVAAGNQPCPHPSTPGIPSSYWVSSSSSCYCCRPCEKRWNTKEN